MNIIIVVIALVVVLLCGIVLFGAPFVPTKKTQIISALNLLNLKRGEVLYDLGAGDGRVALAAAKRGIRVVGFELNIFLVILTRLKTRKYKNLVTIKWQNYLNADFSKCDGAYIFSTGSHIKHLDKKLRALKVNLLLTSYAFEIPNKKPINQKDGVFLYEYEGVIK